MGLGLPELALAVGVAGTATSVVGSIASGQAASDAAHYQAAVANNNAIIAEQNAQAATKAGQEKVTEEGLRSRAKVGAAIAGAAASGVDVNSGSAADVIETNREVGRLDEEQTARNAALQAYGYRTQGVGFKAEAGLDEAKAENAALAGDIGAAGSLFSNASSLGLKYASLQSTPTTGKFSSQLDMQYP